MWLWGTLTASGAIRSDFIRDASCRIDLEALSHSSILGPHLESLRGRIVLLAIKSPLTAALAMIELDGVAQRLVLCPPDLAAAHVESVIRDSGANAYVRDPGWEVGVEDRETLPVDARNLHAGEYGRRRSHTTEWILFTSGSTGAPKLVQHTLASLTSTLVSRPPAHSGTIWSTFYDIRRYGGLQIFLRALHQGSLVLADHTEATHDFLRRIAASGVTHLSGTPSHWRRALMSGTAAPSSLRYVRLSGEIADQPILDALTAAFPGAKVVHAFASTEAGVGFEVTDGLAGFPAALLGSAPSGTQINVTDGTLRLCSPGNATCYLGRDVPALKDVDGYVDTGDRVELRADRYHFIGRSGGVINVGGLKVYPEEVEAVINSHPRVRVSLVKARRSPITGALVAADVVLEEHGADQVSEDDIIRSIADTCRRALAAHKVPMVIRIVPALAVAPSGKLVRPNA